MITEFNLLQKRFGRVLILEFIDEVTLEFTVPHWKRFVVHAESGKVLEVKGAMAEDEETDASRMVWCRLNDYVRDDQGRMYPRSRVEEVERLDQAKDQVS